ncbi:MAG: GNAT family N-acetyltransferase [Dehalococcoidales bacterium]|nr:GNAT family N-acetyltransferase [Dehalococcoidales bacterium]
MVDIEKLLSLERSFYGSFSNVIEKRYGVIYYNPDNPQSHDSNHAQILRLDTDIESAIQDITRFYRQLKIPPRIYMSFLDNELGILKPYLESAGFVIKIEPSVFFVFPKEKVESIISTLVRRITRVTDDDVELIHTEDAGDWSLNVIRKSLPDPAYRLLGLFQDNRCLAIASIRLMDGYSRVDDVYTHKDFRGQGLAAQLIGYLVNYHRTVSGNVLYLWAVNPVAIRLYERTGFQKMGVDKPCWSAYL